MAAQSNRRYYLFVSTEMAAERREDLANDLLAKRDAATLSAFPPKTPFINKLKKVISAELFDILEREIFLYQGLEDLQGATLEELQEAGLSDTEAAKVLTFLETL